LAAPLSGAMTPEAQKPGTKPVSLFTQQSQQKSIDEADHQ